MPYTFKIRGREIFTINYRFFEMHDGRFVIFERDVLTKEQQEIYDLEKIKRLADKENSGSPLSKQETGQLKELVGPLSKYKLLKVKIKADQILLSESPFASEFSHLLGTTSPFHFMDSNELHMKALAMRIGKRSVLGDMISDCFESLATLRGKTLYIIQKRSSSVAQIDGNVDTKIILGAALGDKKAGQRKLLGILLSQCTPSIRGWQDAINLLAWVNIIAANTLLLCEFGLYTLSSMLSSSFHAAWRNFEESKSFGARLGYGFLGALATPLHLLSFIPSFAADACRYTRHVVDGISNFVSSCFAGIGDFVSGKKDKDYGVRFPTLRVCALDAGKNLLYLIPTALVIMLSFVPGMQFIPAVAKATSAAFSTAFSHCSVWTFTSWKFAIAKTTIGEILGSIGTKIIGWLACGLTFGAGVSLAAKSISGGIRTGFNAIHQDLEKKKKEAEEAAAKNKKYEDLKAEREAKKAQKEAKNAQKRPSITSLAAASTLTSPVHGDDGDAPAATAEHKSPAEHRSINGGSVSKINTFNDHRPRSGSSSSDETPPAEETDRLIGDDTNGNRSPKLKGRSSGNSGIQ